MPSPLPRQNSWVLIARFPRGDSLPRKTLGSASASNFSRLAQRSLALPPAYSPSHQSDPLHRRLQLLRHLHNCSDCFRLERELPGGIRTHWRTAPFHGAPFSNLRLTASWQSGLQKLNLTVDAKVGGRSRPSYGVHFRGRNERSHDPAVPAADSARYRGHLIVTSSPTDALRCEDLGESHRKCEGNCAAFARDRRIPSRERFPRLAADLAAA